MSEHTFPLRYIVKLRPKGANSTSRRGFTLARFQSEANALDFINAYDADEDDRQHFDAIILVKFNDVLHGKKFTP